MEINFATCQIISRFLLPVILLFVSVIRQNVFSGLYLLLFLLSPFFPSPKVIRNQSNLFIKVVFIITTLICSSHVIFQSYLIIDTDFSTNFNDCSDLSKILRIVGLQSLNHLSVLNIFRFFISDFLVLVSTLIFFIITQRIYDSTSQRLEEQLVNNDEIEHNSSDQVAEHRNEEAHGEFYNRFHLPMDLNNTKNVQHKVKLWKLIQITKYFFEVLFLVLLGSCAILNPSVLSFNYFFILLFILTWFGFNKQFTCFYVYLRIVVCVISVLHISILFVYQFHGINSIIESDKFLPRLFGLTQYTNTECKPFYQDTINVLNWNIYLHPVLICSLYLTSIYMVKYHFKAEKHKEIYNKQRADYNDLDNTDNTEQEQNLSPTDETTIEQDDSRQIIFDNETPKKDLLKLNNKHHQKTSTAPSSPSVFNTFQLLDFDRLSKFNILFYLLNLIKKGSYVGTLIIMMTWSITYHSWLGFLLLIASCVIWMMPNSRQSCLKSSVFLIVYAIFLLVSSYVFSLNLEKELPTDVNGISLDEIGFRKNKYDEAYQSLFIKLLYTLVFYITLRQYMEENYLTRHIDNLHYDGENRDNASFTEERLERHMSLAANNYTFTDIDPVLNKTIRVVRVFFCKYWIIIVTLLLMVMSLSGERVVLYRIVYMSLFLAFVLAFQISYRVWRKFIYLFWLIVIFYSMTVLVAIYTYQFKDFKNYWNDYLGISIDWQKSIGLEEFKHDPLLLFKQLFTPTFFIIITIIQVHFFHQEFLQYSNLHQSSCADVQFSDSTQLTVDTSFNKSGEYRKSSANSSNITDELNTEVQINIESDTNEPEEPKEKVKNKKDEKLTGDKKEEKDKDKKMNKEFQMVEEITSESPLFDISAESLMEFIWPILQQAYELFWRALELHMMKIVFICAIFAALDEVSLVNFVFIILIAIGLPMKQFERIICHCLVIWAASLILLKMFYQLTVVQNVQWISNCSTIYGIPNNTALYPPFDKDIDNREYIGFHLNKNVFSIIFKDLIIVLALAFNTLVYIRQTIVRFKRKEVPPKSDCLFIGIHRKDADENVTKFFKFMVNYWFYKFGLEFISVFLVFSIAARRDFIGLIFSLFLFPITLFKRNTIKKLWPFIVFMQTFMLPIQYLLILGLPVGFCTEYPWSAYYLSPTIRKWLFLSDFQFPPEKDLLFYDFFVLLFFCRQMYVFVKENQIHISNQRQQASRPSIHSTTNALDGNGGSNDELIDENYSTTDPNIKDYFLTSGKTILDVLKTSFFSCFYWITLAVLFMTANNRQNLFGLGYIVGCFVFLWNGNDFYLKSRKKVFKNWNYLIWYTWFVILLKTILSLVGCEHAETLFKDYCALAKLFGIDCISKLTCKPDSQFIEMTKDLTEESKNCLNNISYSNSLFWDGVCLLFLIIQKRIFGSYYFNYLVVEIKAQQRLASRGAELIHEIQSKEYKEEKKEEKDLMEKIKTKMDQIRQNQQRKHVYKPKNHYQDFYDISMYETSEKDDFYSKFSTNCSLPTVFSPTPSSQTMFSPSSVDEDIIGKGYLEVYPIQKEFIFADKPPPALKQHNSSIRFKNQSKLVPSASGESFGMNLDSNLNRRRSNAADSVFFDDADTCSALTMYPFNQPPQFYNRLNIQQTPQQYYQMATKNQQTVDFDLSKDQNQPFTSTIKFGKNSFSYIDQNDDDESCRSGDYWMIDRPEDEIVEDEEKEKKSLIPDPIGDELRKVADVRGFSAFCSNFVKGSFFDASPEQTLHIGDSSKDSAIVSIDRSDRKSSVSQRTAQDAKKQAPQPSTSAGGGADQPGDTSKKDPNDSDKKADDDQNEEETQTADARRSESILFKVKKWLKIIKYFFISCLISSTVKLNEVSRDYRYVSRRLAVEKKALKCIIHLKGTPESQKQLAEKISNARVPEIRTKTKKHFKTEVGDFDLEKSEKHKGTNEEDLSELADYYLDYNVLMRFIFAIGYAVVSQSEILCYFCVILNQMKNASLISLPLPLMVFLWGCLSLPRPSKTFWISLITYTEAVVVAKYMFQFKVWEWIKFDSVPPSWPNVSKSKDDTIANNSSIDLFLLLVLFFHRFMLKSLGLWDVDLEVTRFDEESEKDKLSTKSEPNLILDKQNKNKIELENQEIRKRNNRPELDATSQQLDQSLAPGISKVSLNQQFGKEGKQHTYYFAFFLPFHNFFCQLFRLSEYRIAKDFYAFMFLCDFINFFIVVFGYSSFGSTETSTDITTYFREDRIPILFFVMLLIQFLFIIIDRALYLRKNIFYRLIFHISLVIIIHLWLFFVIPLYTNRDFTSNLAPMFWYIFKTIYLILSANQIKSGYPTRILGNCFTKKYTLLNLYLFKAYMVIPFLYDLRLIMDWIWTESSLDLNEWATMEDIFKQLFERKCEINYNDKFPYPRGEGRRRRNKFLMGGCYFITVVFAIWFPLTLFAFGSQVGTPTKPVEVAINLEFSGYQPIFKMSANQNSLQNLTSEAWFDLKRVFPDSSSQFLSYYNREDVVVARISGNSSASWDISPPNKVALIDSLKSNETVVSVKLTWRIKRKKKSQNMDVEIFNEHEVALFPNDTYNSLRTNLTKMLENSGVRSVVIPQLFPNCILIPSKDEPRVVNELQLPVYNQTGVKSEYRSINISLNQIDGNYWWTVSEIDNPYKFIGIDTKNQVALLLFNDRVFPDSIQFLSAYGIVGLYSTFVFVVSRMIRTFFDDLSFKVIYTQLPCVRKVLQLCLDIYLVRESGEFELEEDLYAKLIFLYRSPECLIKWTRNTATDSVVPENNENT